MARSTASLCARLFITRAPERRPKEDRRLDERTSKELRKRLGDEAIADPRLGDDEARIRSVRLELAPQRADVDAHGIVRRSRRAFPHDSDDLVERHRSSRFAREQLENREFRGRQM